MTGTGLSTFDGDGRVDIAVLVEMRVRNSDRQQFLDQQAAEGLLLFGGGLACRFGVRLGVDHDIAQENGR